MVIVVGAKVGGGVEGVAKIIGIGVVIGISLSVVDLIAVVIFDVVV